MTHLWIRAEQRPNETRAGVTPDGVARLIAAGMHVSVEESTTRVIATAAYAAAGARVEAEGSWPSAPRAAFILGLKELPEGQGPLIHRHIMFGHAFKGQPEGRILLDRLKAGGGSLLDLEYLTDEDGRRLAAFGYWAGYAGAAVALICLAAQRAGGIAGPVAPWADAGALRADVGRQLDGARPSVLVIGALGRVGRGAEDLCRDLGLAPTGWDIAETAHGGPFPQVLEHEVFLNCILATPGCPVFVPRATLTASRALRVIGDIACDPTSDFSPIKVYDRITTWEAPALRVHRTPPLDVTAIDNLPSLLALEASQDFAAQLLPVLLNLDQPLAGPWGRAKAMFDRAVG